MTRTMHLPHLASGLDLPPRDAKKYSYARAIATLCSEHREYNLEVEVSDAIAGELKRDTRRTNGIFVPSSLRSGLDTKNSFAGGVLADSDVSADIITLLRSKLVLARAGAQFLPGLRGTLTIPREASGTTAYWVGENPDSDVTQSDPTFGQVTLSPKTLQSTTGFSVQLVLQTDNAIERIVRNHLAATAAVAIDAAGINGSGTENNPIGILKTSGIGNVAGGTDGAVPNWGHILDLEKAISTGNADLNQLSYISTPGMRRVLKATLQGTGSSRMIWEGDLVNGYPGYATNSVPSTLVKGSSGAVCNAILAGDFSQIVIGEWGGTELIVDRFKLAKRGLVEITSFQLVDIALKQPAAVAAMLDAKLS